MNPAELEDQKKVVISPDDCQECEMFFKYFDIQMPEELVKALEVFKREPTFEHQDEVKFQLARAVVECKGDIFEEDIFQQIRAETREAYDVMLFDKKLQDELTVKEPQH